MGKRRKRGAGLYLVKAPKTGIYQIRGRVLGVPVRESTFTTVLARAEDIRVKTEQDLFKRRVHGDKAVCTFSEALNDYLDLHGDNSNGPYLKTLNEHFGKMLMADIKQDGVTKFIRAVYPLASPATKNRQVYTPLIAVFRLAAENEKCDLRAFKRPKVKNKVVTHAPDDWMRAFLAGCTNKRITAIVWLMTTTGVRVGEAVRLRWEDIDVARKQALVGRTKNDDPRMLPLVDELVALLVELKAESDAAKTVDNRVFKYADRTSVNQEIERQCTKLGMTYFSTHKLGRHAMATRMLNGGHTLKEVQEAGGWKTIKLVADTYGHLERSRVHDAMRNVSKGLGKAA